MTAAVSAAELLLSLLAAALLAALAWLLAASAVLWPQRGTRGGGGRATAATHPSDYRPRHLAGAGRHHA